MWAWAITAVGACVVAHEDDVVQYEVLTWGQLPYKGKENEGAFITLNLLLLLSTPLGL